MTRKSVLLLSFLAIFSTAISSPLHGQPERDTVQVQAPLILNTNSPPSQKPAVAAQYVRLDDLTEAPSDSENPVVQSYEDYVRAQGIESAGTHADESSALEADLAGPLREGSELVKGWGSWAVDRLAERIGNIGDRIRGLEAAWMVGGEARGEEHDTMDGRKAGGKQEDL